MATTPVPKFSSSQLPVPVPPQQMQQYYVPHHSSVSGSINPPQQLGNVQFSSPQPYAPHHSSISGTINPQQQFGNVQFSSSQTSTHLYSPVTTSPYE